VQQPWAWAIVHGGKDVENRTQAWSYRGPIAIHAGGRVSRRGVDHELLRPEWAAARGYVREHDGVAEISYPDRAATEKPNRIAAVMPLGAIIGVVDLVDLVDVHHYAGSGPDAIDCCDSLWAEESYDEHGGRTRLDIVHLVLERPRALVDPIPAKGRLGLWTPDAELLDRIRDQVPA
jgi:hypothetical protein